MEMWVERFTLWCVMMRSATLRYVDMIYAKLSYVMLGLVEYMQLQVCKKKQVQLENKTFRCACFLLKWKIFLPIKRYV